MMGSQYEQTRFELDAARKHHGRCKREVRRCERRLKTCGEDLALMDTVSEFAWQARKMERAARRYRRAAVHAAFARVICQVAEQAHLQSVPPVDPGAPAGRHSLLIFTESFKSYREANRI